MMNIHPLKLASRYSRFINLTFRNFSRDSTISSQKSSNGLLKYDCNQQFKIHKNSISVSVAVKGSAARAETTTTTQGLSKLQAQELILRLNSEERTLLYSALQEYQSKLIKDEYQVESVPPPSMNNLVNIAIANAIPFIGFGFLDNFFMILFGDQIDFYLGSYFCLSTMAAAALGNTFSDVLGLGSAYYVERLATRIGYTPPKLSPIQMEMPISRHSANVGRVVGVVLGCLLGMFPLMFTGDHKKEEKVTVVAPI
ncbi:transmembrane protein 65 isoform X2 [Photinus pyralis]|uniref:transmembrane protein 65 isoform X2 n=1 Tax=Photinus pyralis TaxID=7054 RepID=UPI001267810F|nr:transmembrane protein 65 isoform X2 [Photinus pyralis]